MRGRTTQRWEGQRVPWLLSQNCVRQTAPLPRVLPSERAPTTQRHLGWAGLGWARATCLGLAGCLPRRGPCLILQQPHQTRFHGDGKGNTPGRAVPSTSFCLSELVLGWRIVLCFRERPQSHVTGHGDREGLRTGAFVLSISRGHKVL